MEHLPEYVQEPSPESWGGSWTVEKISIFLKYLNAYLEIMKRQRFRLIYFDGFAGSGKIEPHTGIDSQIESVALQVISLNAPYSFDMYYLVELNERKAIQLEKIVKEKFPEKKIFIVAEDSNKKLKGLAEFLRKNKTYRALAFIDPFGMEVNWSSLEQFKAVGCDMWILVPTGIGVNRMLTNDAAIRSSWIQKLEKFLGISEKEIFNKFYREKKELTLFGEETKTIKEEKAIRHYTD